ncbi:MAG: N-6 DNA methylase [Bacteroidetes bacterium]|nr:N-6 DNA methylase [Bacteroidota bacterium]
MRYKELGIQVPIEKRESYNRKIVALIQSGNLQGITCEEIFNAYTGKGGLHGLSRDSFDNYYQYAEAKKQREEGQFFTPCRLCEKIIQAIQPQEGFLVADLSCGIGNFFNSLPNNVTAYGNEIDNNAFTVCKFLYPSAILTRGDFVYYAPEEKFDIVIGNPPFNLNTIIGVSQFAYIRKASEVLNYGGLLAVIVPLSFLADEFQDKSKIEWVDEHFDFIAQCKLPTDSFEAAIETKFLLLQKKGLEAAAKTYKHDCYTDFEPEKIFTELIAPIYEQNKKDAPKLHLLSVQNNIDDAGLQYQIRKCLWHIKSNPSLQIKYHAKAIARLDELKQQRKPDHVDEEEWQKIKLTPEKILRYLKKILHHQNDEPPRKVLKIVKTNYGLKQKAYHKSLKQHEWNKSVHDILMTGERFREFKKLYDRKKNNLDVQLRPFSEMQRSEEIDKFLNEFRLIPECNNGTLFPDSDAPVIELNAMQKNDLGLTLQKKFSILAWEMGGGKSVAGMAWLTYWQKEYQYAFILAPALAINTTWTERLSLYHFDFLQVECISDIARIRKGQIILISYDRLVTLQRHIKKFIKCAAYKIALLTDESDELTNANSQRSRAAINCFRKATMKLLTTGTTTRNNINELYTQLELLYNNSTAFTCWAETIYKTNKENDIVEIKNTRAGYPFPAYNGAALFKACFCPQRSTVFGIKKETQDIYNASLLKEIISKTIITRKFEEIVGEKKYSIHTHAVEQSEDEKSLYGILLKDFLTVVYDFYTTTGNARKEAALRLIRQIKALIKATSIPHLMPHFSGSGLPQKYEKIKQLVCGWGNELAAIGTIFKETAKDYASYFQNTFPQRKIFYIDGEAPVPKRRKILEQFKNSFNGILVCTQQALKSSVNIPYCNKCVIESLQWNIPKISQFYFRFIRFDSKRHTQVHFVNYQNTIELNLLALLMAKEKLNDFIKTTNETTTTAIYEEFGVDLNILDMLIEKDTDADGKLVLRWGKQHLY